MSSITLNKYKIVENDFFDFLRKNLKDNLFFYAVTGSMARNDIILGWSDIDVLVIINRYSTKNISIISDALSKNNSNVSFQYLTQQCCY